jgi:hypothetical protein
MNCSQAEQFFDAYLDGELSGSLRLEFDAHRLRCPLCQQKLAMMEACEHTLARDSHALTAPDDFTERVMDQIRERRVIKLHARRRRITVAASVLAPAAAIALFAFLWPFGGGATVDTPTLVAGTPAVSLELDRAMEGGKVELYAYITDRIEAASQRFARDVGNIRTYVLNWMTPEDVPTFLEPLMPATEEKGEPAPSAADTFSL